MRNVSLIEFDMESHYKDSLSTAIVNILLQCGFENSSKRALDELVGMSVKYIENITSKISNLTNDCNLPESDVLIGLGALQMHGHKLGELFNFLHTYNEIFPPPPKTYFGPIPIKSIETKRKEEKPIEIVSWAPDMSPSLATIGMKLKNRQIVSDPNFDRSNYLALSLNSPPTKIIDNKLNNTCKSYNSNNNSNNTIKTPKYGSNCSYHLPPEAYPNKYEPPTIDVDCNGAVIGLNGKIGKLPDPFISDIEEQDLLCHNKSNKGDNQQSKSSFSHHHHQLFNGIRQKKINNKPAQIQQQQNNDNDNSNDNNASNDSINCKLSSQTPNRNVIESILHEEMKENISKSNIVNSSNLSSSPNNSFCHNNITNSNYKSLHVDNRNVISDDVWNAALQAKVEPLMHKSSDSSLLISSNINNASTNHHHLLSHQSLHQSSQQSSQQSPTTAQLSTDTKIVTKKKKHKRNSSFTNSRPKKVRKIEVNNTIVDNISQLYLNESTMDSYVSERSSVPYSSPSSDRELIYNYYDNHHHHHHSNHYLPDKSPTYSSPIANNCESTTTTNTNIYYQTEIIPPQPITSSGKSYKSKKKSSRKTHFTNKRKKKSFYSEAVISNSNFYSNNAPYPLENHTSRLDMNDNASHSQRSLSINYDRSDTPSPHATMDNNYFDDSDDDRTEPMQESSDELIKMLEVTVDNRIQDDNTIGSSSLQEIMNNNESGNVNDDISHVSQPSGLSGVGSVNNGGNGGGGSIRMKIKIRKNPNSIIRGPSSIINSNNTDLSSPIQSQHSDDKNSISERLQLMHYTSPLSEAGGNTGGHQHNSFGKSPNVSNYGNTQQNSPAYSSTQESFRDFYRPDNSVASGGGAMSPPFSIPTSPNKLIIKPSFPIGRFNCSSTHSSPKTLPALDDCDKIPTLLFKTNKTAKKRKRSRLSSGSKKIKSKKSIKLKSTYDEPLPPIIQKPIERHLISVDDVFSDEDDNNSSNKILDQNHHLPHLTTITSSGGITIAQQKPPLVSPRPMQQLPVIVDKSPYKTPIPTMKFGTKTSVKKPAKSKSKSIVMNSPSVKPVESKVIYNYCCSQGQSYYKSEDGKIVYTCPICHNEDNGSLMLGCDRCEDWYHGLCLGIFIEPPVDQDWFCPRCRDDKLSESLTIGTATKSKSKSRTKKK